MRLFLFIICLMLFACKPINESAKNAPPIGDAQEEIENEEKIGTDLLARWATANSTKVEATKGYNPKFYDGQLIYTSQKKDGLWTFDPETKEVKQLCDAKGAGANPIILEDEIIYRSKMPKPHLEKINLNTGEMTTIEKETSRLSPHQYAQSRLKETRVNLTKDLKGIEVSLENEESKVLSPKGNKNYIYAILSPGKDKILYKAAGLGAFVMDLQGNEIANLGDIDTPSWINEEHFLCTKSSDDGHEMLSSQIYIGKLSERSLQPIGRSDKSLFNPTIDNSGSTIAANTDEGELYIFTLD